MAKLHDNRGEGSTQGVGAAADEPDSYDKDDVNFLVDFGRKTAKFGLQAGAGLTKIEYTNNKSFTRFRDRRETAAVGRFYGRASDKTTYFVQADYTEFHYSELTAILGTSLDSVENLVSVGAEWDVTGKTTGSIMVGRLDKDFDDPRLKDDDSTAWDVGIVWSPRTYSVFSLSAIQAPQETNGIGQFIQARDFNLNWIHNWSDRMSTNVGFGIGEDEFPGSLIRREDDRTSYSLALNYDWKRWLTVVASYEFTDRDSNQNLFDFEKNVFLIIIDMSL